MLLTHIELVKIGDWLCNLVTGELTNGEKTKQLEPKSIELLAYFIEHHSKVLSKEQIIQALWKEAVVSDEVLAKTISKLRKALEDNPKDPIFIETLPKRGYRFKQQPKPVAKLNSPTESVSSRGKNIPIMLFMALVFIAVIGYFVWSENGDKEPKSSSTNSDLNPQLSSLKKRADDYYFQYTRTDNETAIRLYERIIAAEPEYGPAQSGLATALVQKVLRWPNAVGEQNIEYKNLPTAIKEQRLTTPESKQNLERAQSLGERAIRLAPKDSSAHRSLGLVYATQMKFDLAIKHYDMAIELNPNAWGAMINKSEILTLKNKKQESLSLLKQAYEAMESEYESNAVQIRPWLPRIATSIAKNSNLQGLSQDAEIWYRRVLNYSPLDLEANLGLMELLKSKGDVTSAKEICLKLQISLKPQLNCE